MPLKGGTKEIISLHYGEDGLEALYRGEERLWPTLDLLPQTIAYLAAMSVQPNNDRKLLINGLIGTLIGAGLWAKLDYLFLLAAHDEQASRINLLNPAEVLSVVGTPAFGADVGWTPPGDGEYLTLAAPSYTQMVPNDRSFGVMLLGSTVGTTAAFMSLETPAIRLRWNLSNSRFQVVMINSVSGPSTEVQPFADLLISGVKQGSAAGSLRLYKGNTLLGSSNPLDSAAAAPMLIGSETAFGARGLTLRTAYVGAALDETELGALDDAFQAYLTAL